MLSRLFQTKDKRLITVVIGVIVLIFAGSIYIIRQAGDDESMEQAVMAENYLKAGNFDEAVKAYTKALAMKNNDEEQLAIGLSVAYVGLKDYDKALEVLRSCYEKTSGNKIKERIEEVISLKTDYEYSQCITRADIYLSNREYDKAISEYEQAKLIKSKEPLTYQKIAEAYLGKGEYDLALMEVLEGQALTQDEELQYTLEKVESYIKKKQYEELTVQADEYIYQENYEDGIAAYKRAIYIAPKEAEAYIGLASAYITLKKYASAVNILESARNFLVNKEIEDLYDKALELKKAEDDTRELLRSIYQAMEETKPDKLLELVNEAMFEDIVASEAPIYYENTEGDLAKGYGMIIYEDASIYLGDMENYLRKGSGIYFLKTENKQGMGYYYYKGEWKEDIPYGMGKTEEEELLLDSDNKSYTSKVITEGFYYNGLEDGIMQKAFYVNGTQIGSITYNARQGVPQPYTGQDNRSISIPEAEAYVIAPIYLGKEPTGEFYRVEPQTKWGVKPFLKKKIN